MTKAKSFWISGVSVFIGAAVLALMAWGFASATPHQKPLVAKSLGTVTINGKTMPHVAIRISSFPDSLEGVHGANGGPHPDWVTYSNDNLVAPANSEVTMTIDQYDGGGALNNSYLGEVLGTVGGTAVVNGKTVSEVDPNAVGHTFTLRGLPGSGKTIFLSVPLPENFSTKTPVTIGQGSYPRPVIVKFSFLTGSKGVYEWNCEFPCGETRIGKGFGEAMNTFGYMSGTLTVK